MYAELLFGGIAGAIYGAVGYFNNIEKKKLKEKFDWVSFGSTVVLGAVFSAGSGYFGITESEFASSAIGVLVAQLIKKIFNLIRSKINL